MTEENTVPTTTVSEGQDNTAPAVPEGADSWLSQLPDDLKGNEILTGHENVESLAKDYVGLKSSQPVVPAAPQDYEFAIPDGFPVDQTELGNFKEIAHAIKMPQEAATKLIEFEVARYNRSVEAQNAANQAELEKAEGELKTAWSTDYDKNIVIANRAIEKFGGKDLVNFLTDSGLGRNPMMVQFAYKVGQAMSEATLTEGVNNPSANTGATRDVYGRPQLDYSKSMGKT